MSRVVEKKVENALVDYYLPFAKYVNQTRAIPDARDGLKTGARYIIYAMYNDGLVYNKKAKKATATVAAGMRFSPHGDASIYGTACRLAQTYSLRYPIVSVVGNAGTQTEGDNYAAARYLEMKSNEIAHEMTKLLEKDVVLEQDWRMNYTNEEKYPSYFPSLFPYVVNGNLGVGVGMSSSIPPWNLREFCDSAIKVWNDENVAFEEIVCYPDFPTYGVILNKDEIFESLQSGKGRAVILRGKTTYDPKKNEIIITELPYQVYADPLIKQIHSLIESGEMKGVAAVHDGSDRKNSVQIVIELDKNTNYRKILSQLHHDTSLQYHYGINMTMLENGKAPRIYGFRAILDNYLANASVSLRRAAEYDLEKIEIRLEIVHGYLKAIDVIDEIVAEIKKSTSKDAAKRALIALYDFTDAQASAILDMKLSRLTSLEKDKLVEEEDSLEERKAFLAGVLTDISSFKKYVEREIARIRDTYGDERRTEVSNIVRTGKAEDVDIPATEDEFIITVSNEGTIHCENLDKLQAGGTRGRKGTKLKSKEFLIEVLCVSTSETILALSNLGRAYSFSGANLVEGTDMNFSQLFELSAGEQIVKLLPYNKMNQNAGVVFLTKNGLIKVTVFDELNAKRKKGVSAIKVQPDDEIVSVLLAASLTDEVFVATKLGYYNRYSLEEVRPTGRVAVGVRSILLRPNDEVIGGSICSSSSGELFTITNGGISKRTPLNEFSSTNRAIKGGIVQRMKEKDTLAAILVIDGTSDVVVASNQAITRIGIGEIPLSSRDTIGVITMKATEKILYAGQAVE